mgnify:CR=1 FL=1
MKRCLKTDLRRAWWDPTGEASVPSSSYAKNAYQNRKFTARSTADAVGDVAFYAFGRNVSHSGRSIGSCRKR